jgi:serine/threonine-protein kinase
VTLAAGDQIGKYVVRRKLAEGGMAEIYLAASQGAEGFEKEVVIKRVRSFLATDPGFVEMFIAEARLASRLNHANVVQIFDFAKHEDTYYLAMEYVRGCSLADLRKKCKELMEQMPPVLVAHIGAEVARGLHYAHRLKVNGEPLFLVHRDVTPHNVLLSFDGAVKLTDFGIAKAGNKLTSPGMLKGKFAYMSPEQSRGEAVDARTDVFALGIVLWEMLTGWRLFDGDSELAVLRAVQQSAIPPLARINPDIPPDLDAVVMKALERNLDARFQTAGELERALVQCVLNHAKSADDTDLSAFVRRVYIGGIPSAMALPAVLDRTQRTGGVKQASQEPEPAPKEPTAVMPGARGRSKSLSRAGESSSPSTPSPDEDVRAPTQVLPNKAEGSGSGNAVKAEGSGSGKAVKSAVPEEDTEKLPRYEPTLAPPTPTPAPAAPAQASSEAPARSRRLGIWVGLGLLAVLALVGVQFLVRSKPQAQESAPGISQGSAPASPPATAEVIPPATALALPPATPEPPQQAAPDAGTPDAGTPVGTGALAVTPTPEPAPPEPRPVQATPAQGSLVVIAVPYATVLVNGKELGEAQGRRTFKLAPGSYELTLKHPKGSKIESITIEPNSSLTRKFRVP